MPRRRIAFWLVASALFLCSFGRPTPPAASQPKEPGSSLIVKEGRNVSWEGWQFGWSIHPRNGLVLENVSFRGRSVLKYAGLAEIFVPYNNGGTTYDIDFTASRLGTSTTRQTYVVVTSRSYHSGGANVMMLDGSCRFVSESIAQSVWRALGTRAGGEVTEADNS